MQLTFQTIGCKYSLSGSCSMCNYGKGNVIDSKTTLKELEKICNSNDFIEIEMILLGASGSFLDEYEIPEELQYDIMERIAQSHIKEVFIETHLKSITESKLKKIREIFSNKLVHIEMGLETISHEYQDNILNKNITLTEMENAIKLIHDFQMFVSLNVLLGMPFLTKRDQINDTIATIRWAIKHDADYVVIFPINIQPYTLFEWWYNKGYIAPSPLWLLAALLFRLSDDELKKTCLSWYGNRCIRYSPDIKTISPYSCSKCHEKLIRLFDAFAMNFDLDYRKNLLKYLAEANFSCDCRNKLLNEIEDNKDIICDWKDAIHSLSKLEE